MRLLFAVAVVVIPLGLDLYLPVPEDNPLTAETVVTGARLFRDPRLSRDGTISCASCHDPARAFSTDRAIAVGVAGRLGRRNAPALVNRGYGRSFFWDGRAASLEEQVLKPIQDRNEMDLGIEEAAARVGLEPETIERALASYVRSILSGASRVDRFVAGDRSALSAEEQRGLQLFRGKANCSTCHVGPNFSDERFHNTGIAWKPASRQTAGEFADLGRFAVSGKDADRGAFKTPTLREVARTAPYMHDGSVATLEEVVDYYDRGGNPNPQLDPELRAIGLDADEKRALVTFLHALSGVVSEGAPISILPSASHL
jgi:cytochrome c peroxidase